MSGCEPGFQVERKTPIGQFMDASRLSRCVLLIVVFVLLLSPVARAGIYQWKDENGKVHFSDNAPESYAAEDIEQKINSRVNVFSDTVNAQQNKLRAGLVDVLKPADPSRPEIFLVTVAGDAKQAVFKRETLFVQELFRNNYGVEGHATALINHASTTSKHLVASDENLAMVLKEYGKIMNDDDILYLYLTSHGSKTHMLSIDFPPYAVRDFGPKEIRQMLDDAGIKWRIVVVSACYSGGFVEPLASPYTLVATASDALNTSFGCSDDRNFTYYGEAIFKNLMSSGVSLVQALDKARSEVYRMENEQNISRHSNPQFLVGNEIGKKLSGLPLAVNTIH